MINESSFLFRSTNRRCCVLYLRPCTITAVAITFATYILQPTFRHCGMPNLTPQFLAAGCISKFYQNIHWKLKRLQYKYKFIFIAALLALVNCLSVKFVSFIQNFFTIAKLAALVLIISTGIVLLIMGDRKYFAIFNFIWNANFYQNFYIYICN